MLSTEILKIANFSFVNVLLTGETGVGKTYYADKIHKNSSRAERPFIAINCAAIPSELVESELFGSEKGAFTGSTGNMGKLEAANGGTVFLDEIGELNQAIQAKLLTVIEDKKIQRLGSNKQKQLDVRFIFATNRELKCFRSDFLYRISSYSINIPSLRERKEEIRPLVKKFLSSLNEEHKYSIEFDESIFLMCEEQSWMGNIRELKNFVQKVFLESILQNSKKITKESFDKTLLTSTPETIMPESIPHFFRNQNKERKQIQAITKAFELYRDSKISVKEICTLTGVSRATFYRQLAKASV